MIETVGFDIAVLGMRLRVGAIKAHRHWTIVAGAFPEVQVCDLDLARAKRVLTKRLAPEVERIQRQQKEGR
jgi:hypothetical protein